MIRRLTTSALLLVALAAFGGCQPAATVVTTASPGGATPSGALEERVVGGGFAVIHEWSGNPARPSLTADQVVAIVRGEIAAGRATIVAGGAGIPAMAIVEASFSAALADVFNPAGGPSFQSSTPVAAWVIVLKGHGVDGDYTTLGVVDDATGKPLVTQVFTPGAG
jgi:hypothetical protein